MWSCPTVEVALTIENFVHQNGDLSKVPYFENMNPYWQKDWYKVTQWRKDKHRYDNYDFMEEIERERIFIKHSDRILLGTDVPNPVSLAASPSIMSWNTWSNISISPLIRL